MIASVVVTFDQDSPSFADDITKLSSDDSIQLGDLIEGRKLPLTIDSADKRSTEQINEWISQLDAVVSVDVVFVHFGDETEQSEAE